MLDDNRIGKRNIMRNYKEVLMHIRHPNLQRKLLYCFLLISVISTTFIGIFIYNHFNKIIINKYIESTDKGVLLAVAKISYMMQEIYRISDDVFSNKTFQKILTSNIKDLEVADYETYNETDRMAASYNIYNQNIHNLIIMDRNLQMFSYKYNSGIDNFINTNVKANIQKANNLKGKNLWLVPFRLKERDGIYNLLPMLRLIREIDTLKPIGYVVMNIDEASIQKILGEVSSDNDNTIIAVNDAGIVMSECNNKYFRQEDIKEIFFDIQNKKNQLNGRDFFISTIKEKEFMINYHVIEACGWQIINAIPYTSVKSESIQILKYTILFILISILISAVISFFISKAIFSPIQELKNLMKKVDHGDLNVSFQVASNDEIGQLGNNFNKMIGTIKELIDSIGKKENEKRRAELKLLQAQINPHFLYNTLDNIKWLAEMKNYDKISLISTLLANFFRIGLSGGRDLIQVNDEIEYVRNYALIQSLRYSSRIKVGFDICEEVRWANIPKMTFQPIVENSIIHCLKTKRTINIDIKGYIDNQVCFFEIIDDGTGIDSIMLDEINSRMKADTISYGKHFGLKNVNQRLVQYFGKQYHIAIESEVGSYTKVLIRFPLTGGNHNV